MNAGLRNITVLVLFCTITSPAQEHLYSISVSSSYTTSAKLFYNPDNPSDFVRSQYLPLTGIFSYGIEIRRTFEESIVQIGASIEYLSKEQSFVKPVTGSTSVSGKDGFTVVPVELTGYVTVPFNSDVVHMYIGGGAGMYIGKRDYEYAGVASQTIAQQIGCGIHILSGFEYAIRPSFVLLGELKFRDIQFETTNVFRSRAGFTPPYAVPFSSRFSIDGMTLKVGLAARL